MKTISKIAVIATALTTMAALLRGTVGGNDAPGDQQAKVSLSQAISAAEQQHSGKASKAEFEHSKSGWVYEIRWSAATRSSTSRWMPTGAPSCLRPRTRSTATTTTMKGLSFQPRRPARISRRAVALRNRHGRTQSGALLLLNPRRRLSDQVPLAIATFCGIRHLADSVRFRRGVATRRGWRARACCRRAWRYLVALLVNQLIGLVWQHLRPFMIGLGHSHLAHVADSSFPSDHLTLLWAVAFSLVCAASPAPCRARAGRAGAACCLGPNLPGRSFSAGHAWRHGGRRACGLAVRALCDGSHRTDLSDHAGSLPTAVRTPDTTWLGMRLRPHASTKSARADWAALNAQCLRETTMGTLSQHDARAMLNKVPEVTLFFWIIKIMATTVGETAADFLNVNLNLGLTGTSLVMGGLLVAALLAQVRRASTFPRCTGW